MSWIRRRQFLKAAGAALTLPAARGQADVVRLASISPHTVRLTIVPPGQAIPEDGALLDTLRASFTTEVHSGSHQQTVRCGNLRVDVATTPPSFTFKTERGEQVQRLAIDMSSGAVSFTTGDAPLLGLGEGGPQFDRRGSTDAMRSGQGGYRLRTFGGRVPIPWIIGTGGWALFFHSPAGTFDFTGVEGKLTPARMGQPLDVFLVASRDPAVIMGEYARITGLPELPALWTLGYQQSHRTLASREEILAEAKTFREKKLPCDTLIYLGTGFCPSGWNTNNGEFTFNQKVFPDPKEMFAELHEENFKVVLHVAYPTGIHEMKGTVADACDPQQRAETQPSCYWNMHKPVWDLGVDGWWPDEGDALNGPSRLVRNRMYWDAPRVDRPNERPYALHRNGYPGMQRYGSFLWSGDVNSQWETLKNHVPDALNTGLSGIPLWGTDIGGFVPTKELTAELYVRWFQFGAFCPLFRSHGRTWKLRLPWGWNTGDPGPLETPNYKPDPSELHNAQVEPICRKYLELRYRLLPYLYSVVRESTQTGMPVMRALWLHYPDDSAAVARGDEYLWGRDILVAPVVEQGAAERKVYLPRGGWHDFWTGERLEGGREIPRKVDLETMPLYVRAGAMLPMGPVKQYTDQKDAAPLTIAIYPGVNGEFLFYEDVGNGFAYRRGEWTGIQMSWNDLRRTLSLRLAPGSRMLTPAPREIEIQVGDSRRRIRFEGKPLAVKLA